MEGITVMGDMNFPKHSIRWSRLDSDEPCFNGDLLPLVASHRDGETASGKQDRLQAAKLCDLATKYCLVQQVDIPTHGCEILDLIFTNNHEQISAVTAESFPAFTDHKVVSA